MIHPASKTYSTCQNAIHNLSNSKWQVVRDRSLLMEKGVKTMEGWGEEDTLE